MHLNPIFFRKKSSVRQKSIKIEPKYSSDIKFRLILFNVHKISERMQKRKVKNLKPQPRYEISNFTIFLENSLKKSVF